MNSKLVANFMECHNIWQDYEKQRLQGFALLNEYANLLLADAARKFQYYATENKSDWFQKESDTDDTLEPWQKSLVPYAKLREIISKFLDSLGKLEKIIVEKLVPAQNEPVVTEKILKSHDGSSDINLITKLQNDLVEKIVNLAQKIALNNSICSLIVEEIPKIDYSDGKRIAFYCHVWLYAPLLEPATQSELFKQQIKTFVQM